MEDAIVLRKLTKTFGETVAVRELDLAVPRGALYGVIGPNGAGKTTTIRMILSILFPDSGELQVLGRRSALEAKDRIGYLPEERGLYKKMRVSDFLLYMARLKGADGKDLPARVQGWLEKVGLGDQGRRRCEELTKGMQQKVQFLSAVMHEPDLLILDEPFSGLDPVNQRLIRDLVIAQHRRGATILFSTHIMLHAEQLCDHVVMIHRGEKVLDKPVRAIGEGFDTRTILFVPLDPAADVSVLRSVPGVSSLSKEGQTFELGVADTADPGTVIRAIVEAVTPSRIEVRRPTLEDVFVSIVSGEVGKKPADDASLRAGLREAGVEEIGR
jgi:ABC-2 type transport system ATP-binding protein